MHAAAKNPAGVRDVAEYARLFECVHCGLCAEACPTYAVSRQEMDSPRGRIYLMKLLAESRLELDADAVRHLDACLGCRGCETACPSGVHYGELIEDARIYVEKNARRPFPDRLMRRIVAAIFPYPARMRALIAPVRILDTLRLRGALRALMPSRLREWLDLIPRVDGAQRPVLKPTATAIAPGAPTVVVHHGCVARVMAESENLNSERLLERAGYRVAHLRTDDCCGALDLHCGNADRARDFARRNVEAISILNPVAIISAASGCSTAIREYAEVLYGYVEFKERAKLVASKVRDLATLLLERPLKFPREFACVVTYHDACHLAHGMGIRDAPRALLRSIPGVKLVELESADMCCGSAGTYNLTQPAMAAALARMKCDNIAATGADYVVLANPGCEFQIAAELARRGSTTRVIHLADFLALAISETPHG
jgi:glycolate oxidase iron-sulfur subunit